MLYIQVDVTYLVYNTTDDLLNALDSGLVACTHLLVLFYNVASNIRILDSWKELRHATKKRLFSPFLLSSYCFCAMGCSK